MATQLDLEQILQQDNFTLEINTIAPTARDILFQKNLMTSPNLQRSPMYQSLLRMAENKFNEQIIINDSTSNLNIRRDSEWVDQVGGFPQNLERENQIYQNKYRNTTTTEFSIDPTVIPQTNASEINQYVEYRAGSTGIGGIINLNDMTADNVGGHDQASERDKNLSINRYLNTDKTSYVVNSNTKFSRNLGIDYIQQLRDLGFDINTDIEKDKLAYSWKDSLQSLGNDVLDTIGNKFKGIPIQTGYELIKRGLAGSNETQLAKDGLRALTNQLGYNIAQNTSEKLTSGLENLLNFKDPFKVARYEITTGGNGLFAGISQFVGDITGIKKQHHVPEDAALYEEETLLHRKERSENYSSIHSWIDRNNNLIQASGKGQAMELINQLQGNLYKPYYEYNNKLLIKDGKLYGNYTVNNGFTPYKSLNSGKYNFSGSDLTNPNQTISRFSWEEGRPNIQNNHFNGLAETFDSDSLLGKTSKIINDSSFGTMINRKGKDAEISEIQSNVNVLGEISRGSNVIKKSYLPGGSDSSFKNGVNEFCRAWTFHDQYDRPTKFIRNQSVIGRKLIKQDKNTKVNTPFDTTNHTKTYSVLDDNGYLKIAPYSDDINELMREDWKSYISDSLPIKKYMFSLENLAWSDEESLKLLHPSEIGNGDPDSGARGRIMWFPPYNLTFNKTINNNLTKTDFIGRGEPIMTYNNTTSNMALSFTLLADHPSIINEKRDEWIEFNSTEKDGEYSRFFGGCGDDSRKTIKTKQELINQVLNQTEVLPSGEKVSQTIAFFFPNDVADDYLTWIGDSYKYELEEGAYPAPFDINIDSRWNLTTPFEIDNDEYVEKITVKLENKITKDGEFIITKIEDEYPAPSPVDSVAPLKEFDYVLNIRQGDTFEITPTSDSTITVDYEEMSKRLFYLSPGEPTRSHRWATKWSYTSQYGRNKTAKAIIDKDVNNEVYKELKTQIENGKEINKLYITIKAYASYDGSKKGWGTGKPRVNAFLAARRAKTIMNDVLPNIFTDELDISKIKSVLINVELYSESEELGKNIINDINSTKGRRVDVVIATDLSKSKNITGNQNQNIDAEIAKIEVLPGNDFRDNLPNNMNYFSKIDPEKDKIVWETLTEKIQFFHPVFHSQTPEDLSTRLTFLEQCSRQGPTQTGGGKAYNLAFGKQPVCILRIGDFVHTKVMVESLSINYEPLKWDLNPEGVGVQPMMANITLNLVLMGGQDISGPINELQNAVSFNYYANSSIFDPRAKINTASQTFNGKADAEANKNKTT